MEFDIDKNVKDTRDSYKHLEVEVDQSYESNVNDEVYPKDCYSKSWDYMLNHHIPNMVLIHGHFMYKDMISVDHAWVEIGNVLFDGVYQRFYDKEMYYDKLGLVEDFKYTKDQAMDYGINTGLKGPWERTKRFP